MSSVATYEENVAVVMGDLHLRRQLNERQRMAVVNLARKIDAMQVDQKKARRNLSEQFDKAALQELERLKEKKAVELQKTWMDQEAAVQQRMEVEEVLRTGELPSSWIGSTAKDSSAERKKLEKELVKHKREAEKQKKAIQKKRIQLARIEEQLVEKQNLSSRKMSMEKVHLEAMREKLEKEKKLQNEIRQVKMAHLMEERQWNTWRWEQAEKKFELREQLQACEQLHVEFI